MKALCFIVSSFLAAASVSASLFALSPALPSQVNAEKLPEAPGKAVVVKVCTTCHGAVVLSDARMDVENWVETVLWMQDFGAEASEEEWKVVTDYIVVNLAQLEVNKAPAKDFAAILHVNEKAAEDVIAYRQKQGPFKTADDLKRAPGLDAATIDAVAPRLIFTN